MTTNSPSDMILSSTTVSVSPVADGAPRVVALILAGGTGERVDSQRPKQYHECAGESILHRTMRTFLPHVDDILVVCRPEWNEFVGPSCRKAPAGDSGFESLCSGIAALYGESDDVLVMIHDAVRPLVTDDVIRHNLQVARQCGNAITAVETYETLLFSDNPEGRVSGMTPREGMYRAQTPQTFTLGTLRHMVSEAHRQGITRVQSPCILARQLGVPLYLSRGDLRNFKITTTSDLALYEALIP